MRLHLRQRLPGLITATLVVAFFTVSLVPYFAPVADSVLTGPSSLSFLGVSSFPAINVQDVMLMVLLASLLFNMITYFKGK